MKKYLKENKTLLILMIVAIVCVVVSSILLLKYFYFGNGGSKFGSRLEGIENYPITEEKKNDIINTTNENENVTDTKISITGKRIDIRIVFTDSANLETAKQIASATLEKFSEEERSFYDIEYTLKLSEAQSKDCPTLMGSKNVKGNGLVWNNCNPTKESTEN